MAGLALYFTANIVKGVSFMIFDESDAYLDQENTMKFIHFIQLQATQKTQMIVITHK